jgi:diguanylate cyclase (GGDEF)-like protein
MVLFSFAKEEINIGIRAYKGKKSAIKEWQPTVDYLNSKIKNYHFNLIPLVDYEKIDSKIKNKELDFIISDPVLYVESEYKYGITRIATLQRKYKDKYFSTFGSIIFVKNDSDIKSFNDLKGKILVGVSPNAFAGMRVGQKELKDNGIDIFKTFSKVTYSDGRGDKVVEMVLSGYGDVGIIRTGLLESMIAKGRIKREDIRILNPQKVKNFPFLLSTKLYPEFPFAKLSHVSEDLGTEVLLALLSIDENSKAAKSGKYAKWLIPNEYSHVIELMQDLRIGVYKDYGSFTLWCAVKRYWLFITSIIVLVIALIITILKLKTQTLKLRETSITDSLTNLYNRNMINQTLQQEYNKSMRYASVFSIIFLDIDNFKQINDTYGHKIGDVVLQEFAKILKENSRNSDVIGRWGGEEFMIIAINTNVNQSHQIAEKLRKKIEEHHFKVVPKVTTSIGISTYKEGLYLEEIIKYSDEALYEAKRSGKNRVVVTTHI